MSYDPAIEDRMPARIPAALFCIAAFLGLVFSAFSTSDFVEHLDRQVHAVHCSFIPGLAAADPSASSGCHAALMSPYSSILRSLVWGGLPMSLLGMATFAFLLFRGVELLVNKRHLDPGAALFLAVSSVLPVVTSVIMGSIAIFALGEACKVCIGIYVASALCLATSIAAVVVASRGVPVAYDPNASVDAPPPEDVVVEPQGVVGHLIGAGEAALFVGVTAAIYLAIVPDFSNYIGACGRLPKPEDPHGILIPIGGVHGGKPAIEVFDPLCPACRGLDERLLASGLAEAIDRKAVMFPLDTTCNWMVGSTMHPGACAISEAILCAGPEADAVIAWAFENQEAIREATGKDPAAAAQMASARFPAVKGCVGSPASKTRLNRSLRWAVANQLPVLTPQLYVDNVKLCDEDTDLGLDYSLSRLIAGEIAPEAP